MKVCNRLGFKCSKFSVQLTSQQWKEAGKNFFCSPVKDAFKDAKLGFNAPIFFCFLGSPECFLGPFIGSFCTFMNLIVALKVHTSRIRHGSANARTQTKVWENLLSRMRYCLYP